MIIRVIEYSTILILIVLLFQLISCTDIFEENIELRNVDLLAPHDGFETKNFAVTFWWDTITGAHNYELQVASPDFISTSYILLDTLIFDNTFLLQLHPGFFQWRVRAINSAYATPYSIGSFRILNTDDLQEQVVILRSPVNNLVTKDTNLNFSWDGISIADEYNLIISGVVNIDTTIIPNSISISFEKIDAIYNWFVVAKNSSSQKSSSVFTLTIDATLPDPPTLISPVSNADFDESVEVIEFKWKRNSNDIIYDSLYLTFENLDDFVDDFPKQIEESTYKFTNIETLKAGKYVWRVKSIDKTLTSSVLSSQRSFTFSKN